MQLVATILDRIVLEIYEVHTPDLPSPGEGTAQASTFVTIIPANNDAYQNLRTTALVGDNKYFYIGCAKDVLVFKIIFSGGSSIILLYKQMRLVGFKLFAQGKTQFKPSYIRLQSLYTFHHLKKKSKLKRFKSLNARLENLSLALIQR